MSTTGMAVDIEQLPTPTRLPARFLDVATELPLDAQQATRWPMHGVKWTNLTSLQALQTGTSGCSPSNLLGVKRGCVTEGGLEQWPFQLADVLELTSLNWQGVPDPDGGMLDRFNMLVSAAFASELVSGNASGKMSLAGSATPPTVLGHAGFAAAAVSVSRALAILESEAARRMFNGEATIHMPPGMLAVAVSLDGVVFRNGHWYTPYGNEIIADAGYLAAPQPDGGGGAAGNFEGWMYLSGPVFYRTTAPKFLGGPYEAGQFDFGRNNTERWLTAQGIVVFDPAYVSAVLATYP